MIQNNSLRMARLSLLLLTFVAVAVVASVQSKITTLDDDNKVEIDLSHEKEEQTELEIKIQKLKEKVKELVEIGKENERAFVGMSEKVRHMDIRVKEMTERLRKINNADYLNAGEEEIKKL